MRIRHHSRSHDPADIRPVAPNAIPPIAPPKPTSPATEPTTLAGKRSVGRTITSVDHDCCPKYARLKIASAHATGSRGTSRMDGITAALKSQRQFSGHVQRELPASPDSWKTSRQEDSRRRRRRKESRQTCRLPSRRIRARRKDISEARKDRSTRPHRSETWRSPVPRTRESEANRSSEVSVVIEELRQIVEDVRSR